MAADLAVPLPVVEEGRSNPSNPLEQGKECLSQGRCAEAVIKFKEALAEPGGETVDVHLLLAEALWQESAGAGTELALPHYEAAARLAKDAGDSSKEGMVALGHGFALSQLGRADRARECLERARALAEAEGNVAAVRFVEQMMEQVAASQCNTGEQVVKDTWHRFATSLSGGKPAVLFLRGTLAAQGDAASSLGVQRLKACGCEEVEVVDLTSPGADVPQGLQGVADSPHVSLPQLFVNGVLLEGWMELAAEKLRERLQDAGVPLGEMPPAEPCHGTAVFSEGLEPWEVALVELVSQGGAHEWEAKLDTLKEKGMLDGSGCPQDVTELETAWKRLAPLVREKLEHQPEMPCGHSCSTCPTRHDCQLHDAVGETVDIEDLAAPGRKKAAAS